jgi:hypothetical protein
MNNGPLLAGLWLTTWQADHAVSRPRRARRRRLRDRAKGALLWPDPSRNEPKLPEMRDTERGSVVAKTPQVSQTQG